MSRVDSGDQQCFDTLRKRSGRRCIKDRAQRQVDAERLAHSRRGAGCQQGVASNLEEVVVPSYVIQIEKLRPDTRDYFFNRACRTLGTFVARIARPVEAERSSIDLAVCGQRQAVQHYEPGRDHVIGQSLSQKRAQLSVVGTVTIGRDQVCAELSGPCRVLANYHYGLLNRIVLRKHRFDFAGLHAEASYLRLMVAPALVFDPAIVQVSCPVSGSIKPRSRFAGEWIRNERRRC